MLRNGSNAQAINRREREKKKKKKKKKKKTLVHTSTKLLSETLVLKWKRPGHCTTRCNYIELKTYLILGA